MAATISRHHGSYPQPKKTTPISMPTKNTSSFVRPVSRAAMEPPELSDTSTVYSSRRSGGTLSDISDEYESRSPSGIDMMDELNERMTNLWEPTRMDRMVAKQAKTSGELNAKQRELEAMAASMMARKRRTKVNFDETLAMVSDARSDIKASKQILTSVKSRAMKVDPDAYEESRRSRHSRR